MGGTITGTGGTKVGIIVIGDNGDGIIGEGMIGDGMIGDGMIGEG